MHQNSKNSPYRAVFTNKTTLLLLSLYNKSLMIEDSLKEKREELLADMKIGQIMEGRVKNITDFGVFKP